MLDRVFVILTTTLLLICFYSHQIPIPDWVRLLRVPTTSYAPPELQIAVAYDDLIDLPAIAPSNEVVNASAGRQLAELLASKSFLAPYGATTALLHTRTNSAVHSIFGPAIETMQPLDIPLTQFVVDPAGPTYFGVYDTIYTFDPETGKTKPFPAWRPKKEQVNFFNVPFLAFDSKRRRLLIYEQVGEFAHLPGSEDKLMAYDLASRKRTVLVENYQLKDVAIAAMAYVPETDSLYLAATRPELDSENPAIVQLRALNSEGELGAVVEVSPRIPIDAHRGQYPLVEMVSVAGRLIILAPADPDPNPDPGMMVYYGLHLVGSKKPLDRLAYVLEPDSGQVQLICRVRPR